MKNIKKFSLYEKNLKIHSNLWKVYYSAIFIAISFVIIKDLINA